MILMARLPTERRGVLSELARVLKPAPRVRSGLC